MASHDSSLADARLSSAHDSVHVHPLSSSPCPPMRFSPHAACLALAPRSTGGGPRAGAPSWSALLSQPRAPAAPVDPLQQAYAGCSTIQVRSPGLSQGGRVDERVKEAWASCFQPVALRLTSGHTCKDTPLCAWSEAALP